MLRAAWKLDTDKDIARIKKLAALLEQKYPQAAASLLEGLEERFTVNRLNIPPALHRCLATTNIIETPRAGVRILTRSVTPWQSGKRVLRWMAAVFLRTEKRFKRIMAYKDLWALERSSTPLRLPARRSRSNINLTAARHLQLEAGHAREPAILPVWEWGMARLPKLRDQFSHARSANQERLY